MEIDRPEAATFTEMTKFHSDDYLEFLQRVSPENTEEISKYQNKCNDIFKCVVNLGDDCPVWEGIYEFCALSAGGSVGI
jgi:histone deacetylase 1/2